LAVSLDFFGRRARCQSSLDNSFGFDLPALIRTASADARQALIAELGDPSPYRLL
jgi:hypothetical protein